jgi:hypothetical protein
MWDVGLTFEYDANAIIHFLMIVFEILNLIVQACIVIVVQSIVKFGDFIKEDNYIFGVNASIKKSPCALVVGELYLFKRLFITPTTCVDPLTWQQIHESQFPNVGLLPNKYWKSQNHNLKLNKCSFLLMCYHL